MTLTRYDYFYDAQIRRYLLQVVRAFSGFQYMTGRRGDIEPQLKIVPCKMAKRSRMVAQIQQNGSDNVMNAVPQITVDLASFRFDPDRLQNPGHVGHVQAFERKRDPISGKPTDELGNAITVERLMPRPFTIVCQIDVWTSNLDQKLQLAEQISEIIYPTFDIQNSDNALDWSALTTAHPQADPTWSSVSIPVGSGTELDILTFQLDIPMWLSPPARVKRQQVIEAIVTNINEAAYDDDGNLIQGARMGQQITTPNDHCVRLKDGMLTLLGGKGHEVDPDGHPFKWTDFCLLYGSKLGEGETQIRLRSTTATDSPEIIGTLQTDINHPNMLSVHIDIDTLPANTLPDITAVIDPLAMAPGGSIPVGAIHVPEHQLPAPVLGQRYLLQRNDLPANTAGWGPVGARVNSIIEYKANGWNVVFNPETTQPQYLVNGQTGKQIHWTGEEWAVAVEAVYHPGYWRIVW
jgi:hypothetical protein